jgi:hypothetical protein
MQRTYRYELQLLIPIRTINDHWLLYRPPVIREPSTDNLSQKTERTNFDTRNIFLQQTNEGRVNILL